MPRPFELEPAELTRRLEEMVDVTFSDLVSEFLLMPMGNGFLKYPDFQEAYEVFKRQTRAFEDFSAATVMRAIEENSRVLGVLRSILGMTPPEWAELARSEMGSDIAQGAARKLDSESRKDLEIFRKRLLKYKNTVELAHKSNRVPPAVPKNLERLEALVNVAVIYITQGAPQQQEGVINRMAKFDTNNGLESLRYVASENVPYACLLYERYLGRPFATHRDSVSELIGEVMENAVEEWLRRAGVSYRRTGRAERIPNFGQAPDFCIPDEINPAVIVEAKITSDDGTARDKVSRMIGLARQRNEHVADGRSSYEVVACIDGRGFRERRADMRQLLQFLDGKVFTTATLNQLVSHSRIREFVSR